jgi:DUF1680 family protein
MSGLGLGEARITGGFWARKMDLVARAMLPYQWQALNDEVPGAEPSHALENFRIAAGEASGEFKGTVFQDSDVAKWIEAASYSLAHHPDKALEARVDEAIRLIAAAQRPDGYVNTYFTVTAPENRWADLAWGHELYCAGHLIEAAVAHNACTGKTTLLDVARRYADCIDAAFGASPGKIRGVCGHPEIELALFRLWRATGEERYRDLAVFFVEERGRNPAAFDGKQPLGASTTTPWLAVSGSYGFVIPKTKWFGRDYMQNHAPLRSQPDATGHAVRAVYLYSAMAEEYSATRDESLLAALRRLWDSVVSRRMYVTGGIGSQAHGERFTADFDLPSDRAYTETCAAIGLAQWAARMTAIEGDGRYADVLERAIYNGILSGVSLDGTGYFYVNPLELEPEVAACRQDHEHVQTRRVPWNSCACCPPNIARLVASLASYLYGSSEGTAWVHHYADSEGSFSFEGARAVLRQKTDYPWSGSIAISVACEGEAEFSVMLRIPGWRDSFSCAVNGEELPSLPLEAGYLRIRRKWRDGDRIELELEMKPKLIRADPRVSELAGRIAIQRGPLVYCAEEIDNGSGLQLLALESAAELRVEHEPSLSPGALRIVAEGWRLETGSLNGEGGLYREAERFPVSRVPARIIAVPYFLWGNRVPGKEMRVWLREEQRL